jgi:hypothetical protein
MATSRSAPNWPSEGQCARPGPEGKVAEDRIGKREFQIELDAGTVTSPAGQTVPVGTSKKGLRGANFSRLIWPRW